MKGHTCDLLLAHALMFLHACLRILNLQIRIVANFPGIFEVILTDAKRNRFAFCLDIYKECRTLFKTLLESCKMVESPLSYMHSVCEHFASVALGLLEL